jgi:IclR family transcriptional regulator, KDG regulon repressor
VNIAVDTQPSAWRRLSSVEHALALLGVLSEADGELGVTELSRRLEIGKSSVHALLTTLRDHRWVERRPSGRYALGLRAFEIGSVAVEQRAGIALMPRAERLAQETGEAVSLAVLDGDAAVVVRRIESSQLLRVHLKVGSRMPLQRSASGKVLLAFLAPTATARVMESDAALLEELAEIRWRRYAVSRDEMVAGVSTIATPVLGPGGMVVAALSLAAPSPRFDPDQWVEAVLQAGRDMSAIAGGGAAGR